MTVRRVLFTGLGLWIATELVGGVTLSTDLDPLARIGTLLVVALLVLGVDALAAGARRFVRLALAAEPLPIGVVALLAFNACLLWLAGAVAGYAGLGFTVSGFLPALLASLIVLTVGVLAPSPPRPA